jgi:hypothetical protein
MAVDGMARGMPANFGAGAARFFLRSIMGTFALFVSWLNVKQEADMGFGKGALLWLIGIPLPIIILLALFMNR